MIGSCNQKNCFPDGACTLGEPDKSACEHWKPAEPMGEGEASPSALQNGSDLRLPWNGLVFGTADLAHIAARGRPTLIGIIGAPDSGKTTFLVVLYLLLLRGARPGDMTFAGSHTLGAWEELASWTRPALNKPPTFPPHTASDSRGMPGLLHMALRDECGTLHDLLFTDAPGEWFNRWATKADAPDALGARWTIDRADGCLVFVDSARLAGSARGSARNELTALFHRMSDYAATHPVGVVWSKCDVEVSPPLVKSIDEIQRQHLPSSPTWRLTYQAPESVLKAISGLLTLLRVPPSLGRIAEPIIQETPFLAFRGHR